MSINSLLNNPIVLNSLTNSINSNVIKTLNQHTAQIQDLSSASSSNSNILTTLNQHTSQIQDLSSSSSAINNNVVLTVQQHTQQFFNINNVVGNYYILTCQAFNDTTLSATQQNLKTTFYNNLPKLNFIIRINLTLYNTSSSPFLGNCITATLNNNIIKYIDIPLIPVNGYYIVNSICKDGTQLIPTNNNNINLSILPNTPIQITNYSVEVGTLNMATIN